MISERLNVELIDSPFDPDTREKVIRCRRDRRGQTQYQIWLMLSGVDVVFVDRVTYFLHESFGKAAVQTVERSVKNPDCRLPIWTWGLFEVKAVVEAKDGRRSELSHYLQYDRWLRDSTVRREWV
jgi:transcription initiation factor IIF auxiliary subunit